ncbi:uncharacterized protein LOC107873541 isoform X2 [Capsicum annuum]|uniref:uncharacterized protein LOC107873541 isoform X2 n=1 Tax=Capsicum annuum TaxID=4072 RepID=UPI001FB1484D|nr:uncharacterized protein LOC107873541 isoform X2 [Capsicum annuum]
MFVGDSIWSCYDKMTYLEMWSFSKEEVVDDGRLGLSSFPKRKEASPTTKGGGDSSFNTIDTFEALTETEQDFVNFTFVFEAPLKLFGEKSHFVIHDAGGVHDGVMEVLKPWMDKGYVTLQDIREQERFDGSPLCKCQCLTSFVSLRIAVNPTDCRFIGYPPSAMASTTMSHVLDRLQLCIGEKYQD